ncbi:MAG: hypothetical protein CM15mP117_20730 [Alphaproteobacteria bacterium]|nr:MAG: hypothetical protein CM15mP117_20730 [Alphaproteobacteria bacterium]
MIAVQSSGCAPIVKAWQEGLEHAPFGKMPNNSSWN